MIFFKRLLWAAATNLFAAWIIIDANLWPDYQKIRQNITNTKYDFIIGESISNTVLQCYLAKKKGRKKAAFKFVFAVGGGTAGCVLAARLSEIADWKILLVEAGGEQSSKVKIPWFHLWLTDSPIDWKYVTEPQSNAMWAFEQQVCFDDDG